MHLPRNVDLSGLPWNQPLNTALRPHAYFTMLTEWSSRAVTQNTTPKSKLISQAHVSVADLSSTRKHNRAASSVGTSDTTWCFQAAAGGTCEKDPQLRG